MFDPLYLWLFIPLIGFGAFAQGFTGIGFGIIILAGMGFTPWDFERTTVALNLLLPILNGAIIFAGRRESRIDWRLVGVILAGEIFGVPLGYWFILVLGQQPIFKIAFGLVLAIFAANELFRPRLKKELPLWTGLAAGFLGGFLAGGFTAAGPPLALFIYSRLTNPRQAKGTLQVVFASATLFRLANVIWFGRGIDSPVVETAALALAPLVIFMYLGHRLSQRVSNATFLKIVYSFIGAAGLLNLGKGLLQMWEKGYAFL